MFTQCPDCQTTFRVTAKVLQQAAGRVRCGGCGNAFNALEHLSEDDVNAEPVAESAEAQQQAAPPTESIDDTNKELLATLEKLAGPDVRIEDTGVEWRVLEEDEGPAEESGAESDAGETSSLRFVLEEDAPEKAVIHGRQDDLPQPVSEAQESLDLPGTEQPAIDPGEMRFDDNTGLPDDFADDQEADERPLTVEPETSKRRESDREAARDTTPFDEAQVDLALGDADDWVELLDEVNVEDEPAESVQPAVDEEGIPELTVGDDVAEASDEDMPSDIDTQFLQQAEDMGLDTGSHEIVAAEDAEDEQLTEEQTEESEQEPVTEEAVDSADEAEAKPELESTGEFEEQIAIAELALRGEDIDEHEDEAEDVYDEPDVELEDLADFDVDKELEASDQDDEAPIEEPDQDASSTTIGAKDVSELFNQDSPMVETIIMEGDVVRDTLDDIQQPRKPAPGDLETPGPLVDTYALNRGRDRGRKRVDAPASMTLIVSVVMLGLLLLGQIMHQSRQTLATYGAFNHTIGPIYRVLGKPVTPEWDIRGWRFEATNGSMGEDEELLTIYSRIGNNSSQALPYPLVHVSLTDRWEEIIGSRVLEPNEYLAGNLDPSKPVSSGENFTAVITVESPSAEATGFKLNVCYRVTAGRMRCATEDFKD